MSNYISYAPIAKSNICDIRLRIDSYYENIKNQIDIKRESLIIETNETKLDTLLPALDTPSGGILLPALDTPLGVILLLALDTPLGGIQKVIEQSVIFIKLLDSLKERDLNIFNAQLDDNKLMDEEQYKRYKNIFTIFNIHIQHSS